MQKLLIVSLVVFVAILFVDRPPCLSTELQYTYDELNRLERLEKTGQYIINYYYDTIGNRTSKTIVVEQPDFNSDNDNDIDGKDLYDFLMNWGQTFQFLSNFANDFGTIE